MAKTGLRRFELLLSEEMDRRLIDHLEKFVKSRRTNEEMRRMLYLALDSVASTSSQTSKSVTEQNEDEKRG